LPKTIQAYLQTVKLFRHFLVAERKPTQVDSIKREHVEAFIADQLKKWKPKQRRFGMATSGSSSTGAWTMTRSR